MRVTHEADKTPFGDWQEDVGVLHCRAGQQGQPPAGFYRTLGTHPNPVTPLCGVTSRLRHTFMVWFVEAATRNPGPAMLVLL